MDEVTVDIGLTVVPNIYVNLPGNIPMPIGVDSITSIRKKGEKSVLVITTDSGSFKLPVLDSKAVIEASIKKAKEYHDIAVEELKKVFKDVE